jgi:hypothetical protein
VAVGVNVPVDVSVGVAVGVNVLVDVGVGVAVGVNVLVDVGVAVGVAVSSCNGACGRMAHPARAVSPDVSTPATAPLPSAATVPRDATSRTSARTNVAVMRCLSIAHLISCEIGHCSPLRRFDVVYLAYTPAGVFETFARIDLLRR